jgi:hypothetical protein
MSYRYGHAFKQQDGWYYWGWHLDKVPEIMGPFPSEYSAQLHADKCGSGKPTEEQRQKMLAGRRLKRARAEQ